MLSVMPFGFLFMFTLLFGSVLSISSLNWLTVWAGLELNLIGFIPLMVYGGTSLETESAVKYFIMQALGSAVLITGSLVSFGSSFTWEIPASLSPGLGLFLVLMSLMLKMGSFPFHFWIPSVMSGLSWMNCLILATWQKLAPLFLLSSILQAWPTNLSHTTSTLLVLAGASSLIGGIGGIGQTQLRALLAYSSIGHVGWMLYCATTNESILKVYFPIYLLISICLFSSVWLTEVSTFNQATALPLTIASPKLHRLTVITMLLSLGGMPPLLGFTGKWFVIYSSANMSSSLTMIPLIMGSLLSLYYYLSLLFSVSFAAGSTTPPPTSATQKPPLLHNWLISLLMVLNTGGSVFILWTLSVMDFT
uniref:NADH-ubiquinone oxidoreductase chain 2 n=1 Tax=Granata lyrata TaxID=479586 RepID=A0A0S1F5P5_GRALY|nr:NADH dehydrogenase subunit 2 [Granata lyrata]ALK03375.1 NADH dehydrogenase subunit 2 [Granata lyrata]